MMRTTIVLGQVVGGLLIWWWLGNPWGAIYAAVWFLSAALSAARFIWDW
jgi:hypothetical protein